MSMPSASMKRNRRILSVFLFVISLVVSSCSIEKNHKTLKFFFDGVPDKTTARPVVGKGPEKSGATKNSMTQKTVQSVHPDFKKKECSKCHSRASSNFLVTERKKLCFNCHKTEPFTGKYIHGPVAVRACNTCHDPHQSEYGDLLLEKDRKLCDLCHRLPVTNDPLPCLGDQCLDCHVPHVADNPYFLKPAAIEGVNPHTSPDPGARQTSAEGGRFE